MATVYRIFPDDAENTIGCEGVQRIREMYAKFQDCDLVDKTRVTDYPKIIKPDQQYGRDMFALRELIVIAGVVFFRRYSAKDQDTFVRSVGTMYLTPMSRDKTTALHVLVMSKADPTTITRAELASTLGIVEEYLGKIEQKK